MIITGPSVWGPSVKGLLVVLIMTLNVRADTCIIILTLSRDKLPRGVINIIVFYLKYLSSIIEVLKDLQMRS